MATFEQAAPAGARTPGWFVVFGQELRDLWVGGRGLSLSIAFSVLVSVIAYLVATNRALNFLEQREAVNLTLQVAIAVGALLALLVAADALSGERERGTLETLLLTPVSRLELTVGKLLAALSLWLVAYVVTVPYVWFLGRGIGIVRDALVTGLAVGTLLAVFLASLGMVFSVFAESNRVSLSVSLLLLLALFAPTQLPSSAQKGWAGALLLRVNPITAGEHYVGKVVVDAHSWRADVSWLASPLVAALLLAGGCLRVRRAPASAARRSLAVKRLRARMKAVVVVASLALIGSVGAPAGDTAHAVSLRVDRSSISTKLGRKFSFAATITNHEATATSGLIAHLNVLSLRDGVYVAVLPRSGAARPPTTGPAIHVAVAERKTLNSAGILPLVLGMPAFLGLVALGLRMRRGGYAVRERKRADLSP